MKIFLLIAIFGRFVDSGPSRRPQYLDRCRFAKISFTKAQLVKFMALLKPRRRIVYTLF